MALSGKVSTTFGPSGHYTLEIDWSATQNTSNNTSTVTAQMWMYSDPQWSMYTSSTKYGNIKLNGTNYAISQAGINTGGGSWLKIGAAQSWTVNHNSDGTGSFTLGGDLNFSGVNVNGTIINDVVISAYTQYLDTIPRETKLSSPNPPNWTAGNSVTFSLTRYSSAFSETVTLEVYNNSTHAWVTVSAAGGLTTSATFGTNSAQNTTIFQALAQQATCQSRLTITTYSGAGSTGSVIGSSQVYTGTVTAPAATKPTMSSFNIGTSVNIILNPTNSDFTHTLSWSWNSYNPTITTGVGSGTYTWDTSSQDSANGDTYANLMYKQIPNSKSLGGTLHCDTYYNSVKVRSTVNVTPITGSVVNSNPTFTGTGITYTDNASAISAITGDPSYIVQNASDLLVSLPTTANAIPTNFATISYYVAQCGGSTKQVNYSSSSSVTFDLGKINLSANDNIYVTAYDSRGFSAQIKVPVNIVAWKTPTFNSTSKRDDGFDDPSTITLTSGVYSQVTIGSSPVNDIVSVKYQYTVKGTAWPTGTDAGALTDFPGMTHSGGSFSAPGLGLTLASGSAWSTEVQVLDKIMQALGQSPVLIDNTINVGVPLLFIDTVNKSVGINMFPANAGTFEVYGNLWTTGDIISSNYSSGNGYTLRADGSLELRNNSTYPYLDWSLNGTDDYDLRLSVRANSTLQLNARSGDSGSVLEMPGTSASLRLAVAGTQSYIQAGTSSTDTNAQLVIARWQTTGTALKNFYINATGVQFIGLQTTTSASAGIYMDGSGNFYRSTSSIKYKRDVQDMWEKEYMKVLDLRPVLYRSKTPNDRQDWSFIGLIAEEVAKVEPRLVIFANSGTEGTPLSELQIENVQYDRLAVMLIPIVKNLYQRVQYLENRLNY